MSDTPVEEPPAQELSSGSGQTLPSRPLQPISDPSASKKVCFYKSGDYKFSGHRMVINARTFKTFDGLLDALAKKVPLPFGVRTITTPRGTNLVKALDDLHDGGSYVCSDNKRVKPLNLDEVNRRQVPWNGTRPLSAGRRRRQGPRIGSFGRRNEVFPGRPAKITERVAVQTPKRLVVIRNRDPTVKRTIVLQRRIAPTFQALLDYLSQILLFPVLKLFSMDGRRVEGLPGLILCSGVVVAAGNEPFRLGNYSFHGASQMAQVMDTMEPSTLQPQTLPTKENDKSLSSGRGSRNFSISSERYIVNQIQKSRNGSSNSPLHHHSRSFETQVNHRPASLETCGAESVDNEHHAGIVPQDDDIEKSFRVNQDGSMTVEMKVRLTIKEEEMLHWTTTLSRSSLSKGTICAAVSELGNSSTDSNNTIAKDSSCASEDETREENHPAGSGKDVDFQDQQAYEGYTSMALGKAKTGLKRAPTPGPRHVTKKASVESVKTVTESGVQESTLGQYSYMERSADGEKTEGYCIVRHSSSSSSSNRPIPKPRKTGSAGASNKGSSSSSGAAEVLQIQNNGMEVTETVMHIYESQGCYDNYFANEEYSADSVPQHGSTTAAESKPSTESGPRSSNNDCDIDVSWQPPTTHSQLRQKEEMLSLSSEPVTPTYEITETNPPKQETVKKEKTPKSETKKKTTQPARNKEGLTSTSSSDKKQKQSIVSPTKYSKHSSTDKLSSNASVGKKPLTSSESAKSGQKSRGAEKPQIKKVTEDEKMPRKEQALINVKKTLPKRLNMVKPAGKDNGHNVNTSNGRPQMKKNLSDILQPKKSLLPGKKTISKPKSMTESRVPSPKKSLELSESSMPSLNPSPSEVHQYVESWLEKVSPDQVPYTEEAIADQSQPPTKVVFKIGGDSESDEKSECQTHADENHLSPDDAIKKSASVGHRLEATALLHGDQYARGLCVSMPSVRVDPVQQMDRLRPHKSAEAIGPADSGSPPSAPNLSIPKANSTHVLHDLYSSIHCIRSACEDDTTANLEKSNSLPNISTQVASAFGSSCKALMSFLSVVTQRDNPTGSALGDDNQSEAMLMMESLQKISAIQDEEELRASLTDLHSRASSRFRERWNDFQTLRERLESEPLSPRFSETEFALDLVSEGGDAFENIEELMDELNMPQDLRAEISSTVQQAKGFYPVEESTFVENERNQSDSEDDLEQFVEECDNETKQSPEPDTPPIAEDITQTKQGYNNGEIDQLEKMQSVYSESDQEPNKEPEISQTDRDETLTDKEEEEEQAEVREVGNDREDGHTKETDDGGEENGEAEKGAVTEVDDMGQEEWEVEKGSVEEEVEEGTEEEMTVDEEEVGDKLEEAEEVLMDEVQEATEDDSVEETDEREGDEETDEWAKGEEEKRQGAETKRAAEVIKESDEGEEEENIIEGMEEEEKGEKEDVGNTIEEIQEEDEDTYAVTEKHVEGEGIEGKDEEEEKTEEASEEYNEEEEESEQEVVEDGEDVEVINIEDGEETDKNMEEDDKCDEGEESRKEPEETGNSLEEESAGEKEVEEKIGENMKAGQMLDAKEREDDEENESNELNEGLDEMEEQESKDEVEEEIASEDADSNAGGTDCKNILEEASYLQQQSSCDEANATAAEQNGESPTKYSSECQCEDDKGDGTDTVNEFETDEGGEPPGVLQHPMEISQELLDFVNSALQSSSLIFTYDARGNVRIEPDGARVTQNKDYVIPKCRKDMSYGLKRLPSPSTSGLSDYRPETSESGGYKTQESVDIVTDSGEEASPACRGTTDIPFRKTNVERADSKPCDARNTDVSQKSQQKSGGSFSSATKASKEDLSYFSAASSQKADTEPATEATQCISSPPEKDSPDGVLIDQGRWLLKENHLIRKSPPVSQGMYDHLDSSSVDTGQENNSEDSLSHCNTKHNPLAAISSSELEEMAKPQTPKCTYYNMPHGSDSDPFLDDSSVKSGKRDSSSVRGRGFRVSPTVDTSKTWTNKNGSMSSFASVEFKIQDGKVHPAGESSAVTRARWTPNGERGVLQAQDSRDTLHARCSQYCPIL